MSKSIPLSRRQLMQSAIAGSASLAMPALVSSRAFAQSDAVNMQLGWIISGDQIGDVVAHELGYFEEEGIDFTIQPGGPNIDGIAMVASGRFEMGQISSSPSLMLAVSQDIPVKAFAACLQQHPFSFLSLPKAPVNTPQDLVGKKVGVQGTARIHLTALLRRHEIPEDSVEVVIVGSDYSPLLTGQVDAIGGWLTNTSALKVFGPDVQALRLWDNGVKLYAMIYYATPQTLEENPELLARFLRAAGRGWEYTYNDTEKAVDLLVGAYPNMNREDQLTAARTMLEYAFNEETRANGWGTFDPAVWQDQISLYDQLGQFQAGAPAVEDVMTTSILEMTSDERPKIG